jgi:molybdenum cofactor guanylyltransferase
MGIDKATMVIDGMTLADRAAQALEAAGADPVVFVGRARRRVALHRAVVDDQFPGEGPMGGVISALEAVDAPLLVVVACDMPSIHPAEIAGLRDAIAGAQVAVSVVDGVDQPLHAVWSRNATEALRSAFDRGDRSLRRALSELDVVRVQASDSARLVDIDTPHDLRAYLARR